MQASADVQRTVRSRCRHVVAGQARQLAVRRQRIGCRNLECGPHAGDVGACLGKLMAALAVFDPEAISGVVSRACRRFDRGESGNHRPHDHAGQNPRNHSSSSDRLLRSLEETLCPWKLRALMEAFGKLSGLHAPLWVSI